ncbi:fetal and adult testis-expressed transcript protein [Saccopteryx leptura]|uniref:fetal and adult testis-expressed transcript protein n=1 Tax=Saccopteryx leptura TaxID=249018 RepID=UPI00339BC37D
MAGAPSGIEEEIEISMDEELDPDSRGQNQDHLMIADILDRGTWSLGVPQRRQNLESKAAGAAAGQSVWSMTATRPKKMGTHLPIFRMPREQGHGDVLSQDYPGSFQSMRFHYDRNPATDISSDIDVEEPSRREMKAIRRELRLINGRLCALEDHAVTTRQREAVFLTVLLSVFTANIWLWIRQ